MYKKTLLFIATAIILLSSTTTFASKSASLSSCIQYLGPSGTINQEGEFLLAYCNESNTVQSLTVVEVTSGKVAMNVSGCYQSKCSYDISNLASGKYVANASFSDGSSATLVFVK